VRGQPLPAEEGDEGAGTAAVAAVEVSSGSAAGTSATTTATHTASSISADSVATYDEMLTRIFDVLRRNNPELADRCVRNTSGGGGLVWRTVGDACSPFVQSQEGAAAAGGDEGGHNAYGVGELQGESRAYIRRCRCRCRSSAASCECVAQDNCASIKRTQEHVMQFFLAEMDTTG